MMDSAAWTIFYAYALTWFVAGAIAMWKRSFGPLVTWLAYHVVFWGIVATLFPFYWMLIGSFKSAEEAGRFPPTWWPEAAKLSDLGALVELIARNYRDAWNSPPGEMTFARYFWVSVVTGAAATLGALITSILAAYAFARMRFAGKSVSFLLVITTLMIPAQVLVIPNYLILERVGWLDSYAALIAPFVASVFAIFLLRQFFMTLPDELWDAARIDGAGRWTFLWRVVIPLSRPALATVALLTFLNQWNALLWPIIATTRPEMRTLMAGLQTLNEELSAEPNLLMAASAFSMAPIVAIFFCMQRLFIQSIARTGIKG